MKTTCLQVILITLIQLHYELIKTRLHSYVRLNHEIQKLNDCFSKSLEILPVQGGGHKH